VDREEIVAASIGFQAFRSVSQVRGIFAHDFLVGYLCLCFAYDDFRGLAFLYRYCLFVLPG
jgi:hypothetical protein